MVRLSGVWFPELPELDELLELDELPPEPELELELAAGQTESMVLEGSSAASSSQSLDSRQVACASVTVPPQSCVQP